MAKTIFEELGGKYERHLDYLKQYREVTYTYLRTSGRLNAYLADIDRQAQERFERLTGDMKQAQGNRTSKGRKRLRMDRTAGNIRACAREIVNEEIIFA